MGRLALLEEMRSRARGEVGELRTSDSLVVKWGGRTGLSSVLRFPRRDCRMYRPIASLVLLAACATPAPKMSFAEAGILVTAPSPEDSAERETPSQGEVPASPGWSSEAARPGAPLDPLLVRFAYGARERRADLPASASFPDEAVRAWQDLLLALDPRHSAYTSSRAELGRARITVETELELDRRRFGSPPPELATRVDGLLARLLRSEQSAPGAGAPDLGSSRPPLLAWPIDRADLTSPFGARFHPILHVVRMHEGIDLAAAPGRVVHAAAAGYVVRAGPDAGYGLLVELRHSGELSSRYAHLSRLFCSPGEHLEAGAPLGLLGATGRATGPHLHFEVWRGGEPEDPLAVLVSRGAGD